MSSAGSGEQREVARYLEETAFAGRAERIDTHGAVVFLAGDRAYKMKRAVTFSFMDFGTLERRERALRDELRLNRRTAPELYLNVLPVTREPDGALAIGGSGAPVEWLLEMRRFPQDAQLDRLAEHGELSIALVERLARVVVAFHERAEIRRDKGGAAAMREVIEGNAGDLASLVPAVLDPGEVAALNEATRAELARRGALLDERRAGGRVRWCHGDLHLANIVLLDGRPVLFDGIEFSEDIACIDVLYDLAFLLMDLLARGLTVPAHRCLQACDERAPEDRGWALLPLFLSMRAAIRAKIAGFTVAVERDPARRRAQIERARAHLALARRALAPAPPRLLAIGGRSGTGKTALAFALAPSSGALPGAVVLRSDVIRKRLFGREPAERLPPEAYAPEVSVRVFATIAARAAALLPAGRTVIADAVYGRPEERARIEAVARECGVPFTGIWLEAPEDVMEQRVAARTGDASDADVAVVRRQRDAIDPGGVTWPRLAAERPLDEVVAAARALLRG